MKNLAALVLPVLFAACSSTSPEFVGGLGDSERIVSTRSAEAQAAFNEGLILCWGFNHDEAILAFEEASRVDPNCAMAWWGIAYALSPNINAPLTDPDVALRAYDAAQKALELADQATPVERALIDAMALRYSDPPTANRGALDRAYSRALGEVRQRFPNDPEVAVFYADSLMLLSNLWRRWPVDGYRGPHTPEIVATLESVLDAYPDHPGANHFYIHAVEASDRPERGIYSSDLLTTAVPAAGHLVHMPAHIYIRVGQYLDAVEANALSVAADDAYFATAGPQGIYHFYRAHNHHFLIWAAMFMGARGQALTAARDMVSKLPMANLDEMPQSVEQFLFTPIHVMMRFGLWEQILAEPAFQDSYPLAVTLWHHARAVAYANTGRLAEAADEAVAFEDSALNIPAASTARRGNSSTIVEIARNMMFGEIFFKQGRYEESFAALRRAVAAEDSLPYSEPPGWMQPMRHALGALLLEAGELLEAEAVYRADLAQHAENGWSLHGLAESLRRMGRLEEAADVQQRFEVSWAYADVQIQSSCFCRVSG